MRDTLLVELLTEELPPKSLQTLGNRFAEGIAKRLQELRLRGSRRQRRGRTRPRAGWPSCIEVSLSQQPEREVERKGPPWPPASAPTARRPRPWWGSRAPAAWRWTRSRRCTTARPSTSSSAPARPARPSMQHLAAVVQAAIKELPIPKLMRWGEREDQFVRPVHGLVMLHGARVVPGEVLGLQAGNTTRGHRFLAKGELAHRACSRLRRYAGGQGRRSIASFETRRGAYRASCLARGRRRRQPGRSRRAARRSHGAGRMPGGLRGQLR